MHRDACPGMRTARLWIACVLAFASVRFTIAAGKLPDEIVRTPLRRPPYNATEYVAWNGTVPTTGRKYTAYRAVVSDPSLFAFQLPADGCYIHRKVSVVAGWAGCEFASNAADFTHYTDQPSWLGSCMGNEIINGSVVLWTTNSSQWVNFGINANETVIGYLHNTSYQPFDFRTLNAGRGWLLKDGEVYLNHSRGFAPNNTFFTRKAPRTGIGVTRSGDILIVVVDGCETMNWGLDLWEFAAVMREAGGWHAVNLDGGGSSEAFLQGRVWSRPTCTDFPNVCERNVTSIVCVQPAQSNIGNLRLADGRA